jgi:uncharacterized protein (DUF1810 family)
MNEFNLERFTTAQAPIFATALAELTAGRKRTHWMWFIFPQLRGLGTSAMATTYGITSRAEAQAYLAHPLLGSRLLACTNAILAVHGQTLHAILGSPDDMKFRSCMTLFAAASDNALFRRALDQYCNGQADDRTLALLSKEGPPTAKGREAL